VKRRRGASPCKVIGTALIILFFAGMVSTVYLIYTPGAVTTVAKDTGINFTTILSSLGFNMKKPIGITIETNNKTLAGSILTVNGPFSTSELKPLILQPNVTYVFNITIVPVNGFLWPIANLPWNITVNIINSNTNYNNLVWVVINNTAYHVPVQYAYLGKSVAEKYGIEPIAGTTPIYTTLTIRLPANSSDTIFIYTPSGESGQGVVILAKTS